LVEDLGRLVHLVLGRPPIATDHQIASRALLAEFDT
jgi:hypothetical protein